MKKIFMVAIVLAILLGICAIAFALQSDIKKVMAAASVPFLAVGMALSHNETRDLLHGELNKDRTDDEMSIWIADVFDADFVYEEEGQKFRATYMINEDGTVTIGAPERVKVEYAKFAALTDVGVAQVGTFFDQAGNEITFTSDDLDDMLNNFNEFPENKIPMVVGHNDGDESTLINAITVGAPVVGYMKSVKRVGDDLLGTFMDIAEGAVDKVGKTLVRVSPEVFLNFKDNEGKAHGKAFRRISLIDRSAIQGLGDITGDHLAFGEGDSGQKTSVILLHEDISGTNKRKEKRKMDPKLIAALAAIAGPDATPEQQAAALAKLQENVTKMSGDGAAATKELAAMIATQKKGKIDGFLTKLSESGKLAPAHKDAGLSSFMMGLDDSELGIVKFGEGADAPKKTPLDFFMGILEGGSPLVKLGEVAQGGDADKGDDITPEQREMNKKLGITDEAFSSFSEGPAKPAKKGD